MRQASRAEASAEERSRKHDPERRQPRGGPVDDVVEPGGCEAEGLVAWRPVADHTVGGVDRLVGDAARQPGQGQPERGGNDPVREILRQALDRRAGDAGLVERGGIATDDHRHGGAGRFQAWTIQRVGHGADVGVETALRDETRCEEAQANDRRRRGKNGRRGLEPDRQRHHAGDQAEGSRIRPPIGADPPKPCCDWRCGRARRWRLRSTAPDGRSR